MNVNTIYYIIVDYDKDKMKDNYYQICTRCVMDTSDPDIVFNKKGVCNHCINFDEVTSKNWFPNESDSQKLKDIYTKLKKENSKKPYDCILGLSGGLDSSYLALKLYEAGIRPLVVHVDGGWNSELAVQNIEKIINYCGWDLHTIVIDWEEMKDLQLAYLKSGISNQDVPQDHAFSASLFHYAVKNKIRNVINGGNIATESVLPNSWLGNNKDSLNLKSIHKEFGKIKLKKYKTINFYDLYFYYPFIKKMKTIRPLNFMKYVQEDALKELKIKIGYKEYSKKHGESIFTKFFQNFWLPMKFGYDKRRPHLSSLILSNQITRNQAINSLKVELYNKKELDEDKEYIAKKLGVSNEDFDKILNVKSHNYNDFPNIEKRYNRMKKIQRFLEKLLNIKISNYSLGKQ